MTGFAVHAAARVGSDIDEHREQDEAGDEEEVLEEHAAVAQVPEGEVSEADGGRGDEDEVERVTVGPPEVRWGEVPSGGVGWGTREAPESVKI